MYNKNGLVNRLLEGMLEDFLSKLGASTRITVGVAVSPGIGLEMIEVDRNTNTVSKYAFRPLDYNNSSREITDYDQFRSALEELFEELHIPKKSNIVLSLPNVHFGMINLPVLLTDEAVTNAIISEVEQSYVFKRQEPVVAWSEVFSGTSVETRTLAYTAIQKEVLTQISDICSEIGCSLAGLENSYSSLFRALDYMGVAEEQMRENVSWNLMVIMQNNYAIISMNGRKLVEYYEEPLALKSFVDDEIYSAIRSSAQLTLAGLPANYLYIVSETDMVSAEVLSMKITVEGTVKFLECNKFIQNELMPVNLDIIQKKAMQITPEAIGVATYTFCDFPLKLNIIQDESVSGLFGGMEETPKINIGNLEVEITPDFIKKLSMLIGGIVVVPIFILFLFLNNAFIPKEQANLDGLNSQIESVNKDIQQYKESSQDNTFDIKTTVNDIVSKNKTKFSYFRALGVSIPDKLWITSFRLNEAGQVDIKGQSNNVKSIYLFYKNLKQTINNSDIRLYKLEIASGSVDDIIIDNPNAARLYDFEVTNMSDGEVNAAATPAAPTVPGAPTTPGATDEKKPALPFGNLFAPASQQSNVVQPAAVPPPPSPATDPSTGLPQNLKKIENF